MENRLPPNAEAYLTQLARELWPIASDERASILLELRSHLIDRAATGALDSALASLGPPRTFARAFDFSRCREAEPAPLPEAFAQGRRKRPITEVAREVHATLRASRSGLFLVGALLVTGLTSTTFLAWTSIRLPWVGISFAGVMAVRLAIVLAALCAAYRLALSQSARPWSLDRSAIAFCAATLCVSALGIGGAAVMIVALKKGLAVLGLNHGLAIVIDLLATLAALAGASILFLRVQPWLAGLAAGRPLSLKASWRGMSGRTGNIVKGWIAVVLPFYLAHFACDALALRLLPFGPASLALAALDAALSTGVALGAVMLNATAYRWVVGEPIPAPSPFSTEPPSPESIETARARLRLLIGPAPKPSI